MIRIGGDGWGKRQSDPVTKKRMSTFADIRSKIVSQLPDLNRRPADYKSAALPAELSWPFTTQRYERTTLPA